MAYWLSILNKCASLRCQRTAKARVYNSKAEKVGDYCEACADREVAKLDAIEGVIKEREGGKAQGV